MSTREQINMFLQYPRSLFERGVRCFRALCITPRSENEDTKRHELILNNILCAVIPLLIIFDGFIIHAIAREGSAYRGTPFLLFTVILLFFIGLLILSRKGYYQVASFIFIILYFAATTYGAVRWGVELPLVAISYVIIIVTSSVLMSTRFGFFVTSIIAATITIICILQSHHLLHPLLDWKHNPVRINDAIELSVVFFLVTTVSWLSNREMERSLVRARTSEQALLEERNLLEIKVEERTKELKDTQEEKIIQLYRFAEFGRLSGGVFHDLMNSLQAVVATVSRLENTPEDLPGVKSYLAQAVSSSKRMGTYIETVRKQIATDDAVMNFSLEKEIRDAIDMLKFHAREANVSIRCAIHHSVFLHGNPIKFYQTILNLLANAIDACKIHTEEGIISVLLFANKQKKNVTIVIKDNGCGIAPDIIESIFNPFFTTKHARKGIGLGLSQTKEIVQKEFNGTISVTSIENHGSTFTIKIPLTNPYNESSVSTS